MTEAMVLETCQKWLPAFMVPGDVVMLKALPYLASGKCDRRALRSQYEESQASGEGDHQSVDADTTRIISILREVLGVEVNATSLLPSLGLDSLSSIRIASAFRRNAMQQLDAGRVLSSRTPLDLSAALKTAGSAQLDSDWDAMAIATYQKPLQNAISRELPAEQLQEIETSYPCTPVQIAMLTETNKDPEAYCNWLELDVPSCSDPVVLETALHRLANMHSMLRSGFVALTKTQWTYATVVWNALLPSQIEQTSAFDYSFRLNDESQLLRPCRFQVKQAGSGSRLLMLVHHALYDQWAVDILRADLASILRGEEPSPPGSFKLVADFYVHQRDEVESSAAIEFWQDHLQDVTPTCLPLLRATEAKAGLKRVPWRELSLQSDVIKTKSKDLGCSSPAIFQAAMAYILAVYSGVSDVTMGSVFSGRTLPVPDIDNVFGPCLATLPFRIDHGTVATCRDLVLAVTQRNRAMQNHVMTSPAVIRQSSGIAPGVSLFDSLFVWQETTLDTDTSASAVTVVDSEDRLEFNLVLEVEPSPTAIKARATYQQSVIGCDQVEIFLSQIETIATHIVEHPDGLVEDLAACLAPELLSISNSHPEAYANTFELTDLIAKRGIDDSSATAILFATSLEGEHPIMQSITYAELDARANQMAHKFIASGLQAEGLVCICMEKCIDLYVAMLASFKAGAGYLPLVPDTPTARIKSVLAQVNVGLCVCDLNTVQTFQDLTDATILDLTSLDLSESSTTSPEVVQNGSRVSYAVFTSGSTGEPKGVAVTMDNLKGNLAVLGELYQVRPGNRLLQACSQAFDVSVFEIFFAFYSGMCLCSATKDVIFRDFEHSIRAFGATHLSLTPTVAALVNPENVPTVQFLVTAGEGITERVHRRWAGHGLHQGYGPSETTNICSVKMNLSPTDVLGNIGPPFKNTSAFVLSPEGDFRVLPAGAYGEYAFGGEQVFRGYIGRDDLNSTKIIDHPEHGRVYRSGDMGRILPDGTLLIAGRLDDQVKIRGNRVELGEINAVISDHPGVSDCTTLVFGERSAQQSLASFWVPSSVSQTTDTTLSVEASASELVSKIFDRLEDALPAYMIPTILVPLNRLPMTTQGKLDKRLLRSTFEALDSKVKDPLSRSHDVSSMDGPSSPMEQTMADTLSEMLEMPVQNISRNSSFFALGLNSLNAIQFARSLEQELRTKLSVTAILRHSSIARLARVLSQDSDQDAANEQVNVREVLFGDFTEDIRSSFASQGYSVDAILPCTPLQQAMLSASGANAYCNTIKLSISGDMQKLQDCWYEMARRHTILRTSFVETPLAAQPFAQVVLQEPPLSWYQFTSYGFESGLENEHANGSANGYASDHSNGHINGHPSEHLNGRSKEKVNELLNGYSNGHSEPRSKAEQVTAETPIRIEEDGTDIYIHMHHAIYDGISVANLFSEIQRRYNGEFLPEASSFEPFLERVVAQNGKTAIDFWSARMQDFHPHPFPVQEEKNGVAEKVYTLSFPLPPSELRTFSERHSCTSLVVLQAAWVKTLACTQAITDICFGNVVSGRSVSVPGVDNLVAPCFNTIPLRTNLDKASTNLDLIRDLQRTNVDALSFQLTAPRKIQTLTKDPSRHLFDSVLLVQPPQSEADIWTMAEESMDMGIPIVFEIVPGSDTFELQVHYLTNKVPEYLVPALAKAFTSSLTSCLRYPSSPIGHFMDFDVSHIAGKLAPVHSTSLTNGNDLGNGTDSEWSPEESMVRQIFSDLSGVALARISKQTSLYQIGLDSLNAVQVASQLRKLGKSLDAADVLQFQTPRALAGFITSKQHDGGQTSSSRVDLSKFDREHRHTIETLNISADKVQAIRPCTAAQSGMLAQFIQSQGNHYLNHSSYQVPEDYSVDQIKTAWMATQRKHQVLRMGFVQLEAAATPFAMLLYKPGTFQDDIFSENSTEHTERDAGQAILDALHLPAWRVSFVHSASKRIMCLSLHHSLYDADSLRVLHADFARALRGCDLGHPANIDPVLTNQLEGAAQRKAEREKFWTSALRSSRLVKFPNLTPNIVSHGVARSVQGSSQIDTATLDTFCRREGVTIQALGQSVWAKMLSSYLGEPDVTFGTVFSGFSANTSNPVAFPTISTVPVYCNTSKSTAEILRDMVSYNASAQRYRFAPLADIQRYAGSAGQALFDTIFVYQKSYGETEERFDWHSISDSLGIDYTASMEMEVPTPGKVHLQLTYDTRVIPDAHASLMVEQFDMLLKQMTSLEAERGTNPDTSLMSIVPPKERTLPCTVELLHQFLERGAVQHPQKPALEFIHTLGGDKGRKRWTYEELDHRSNQVAHLIQQHGVQSGGVVAVCMSKSAEATFAFVGILKAGCAFLAMDPDLPLARRKFIMEDSQSGLLFVDSGKSGPDMQSVVQSIELTEAMLMDLPSSAVSIPAIDPSATSYILYTSGTTGTPKGCELTHENAVQAMMAFQRLFAGHWSESSRWLQFASYWFDVSVLEQFWSWSAGITVVGAPRDLVLEDLPGFIQEASITHIDLTPSLARLLKPEDVRSLWNHVFITGGESLKQEIIDLWGPLHTIYNGYGPTEATIGVTMNPHIGADAKPSNIGPPFDNVGAFVFAPDTDEPVMRGGVGELCVSGKLVGKGYLNRPDLTEKMFPYLERHNERVYRTGDLVRLLADGSISFIGRKDTQAKLRGQRLEIDEIDAVIKSASDEIADVASLVVKSADGNRESLASFIVDRAARSRDVQIANSSQSHQLVAMASQACRDRLPGYMVPTHIIPVSRLPLTVNNKVDTKKLVSLFESMKSQDLQQLKGQASEDRPMLPAEEKIAKSLGQLLSVDSKTINSASNIFSLGLSSVSAINFATQLKRNGFSSAGVAVIMNNPTVNRLAEALADDNGDRQAQGNAVRQAQLTVSAFCQRYRSLVARSLSVDVSEVEALAPCTPLQEGLLVESLKTDERPYFNDFWYDVGSCDLARLETAVRRLHRSISMLRTSFLRTDEGFCQAVLRNSKCPFETFTVEDGKVDAFAQRKKAHWASKSDQEVIEPFQVIVVRTQARTILVLYAHHALYDGISWDLTMDKLQELYRSDAEIKLGPAFIESLPYGPLCHIPGAKPFWQNRLAGTLFKPLQIDTDASAELNPSISLHFSNSKALEDVRRQLGVSHQALLQAAFVVALHQVAPETQSYGVVLSGRSIPLDNADAIIGPMFNTVPSVVDVQASESWSQYLKRCHDSNAGVLPFQHTPLRDIRKFCNRPPTDALFDVLFVFQRPDPSIDAQQGLFKPIDTETTAEYPLAFEVELGVSGEVAVTVASQRKSASTHTLQSLANSFEAALECMVDDVNQNISKKFAIQERLTNGVSHTDSYNAPHRAEASKDFTWSDEATVIRDTIARVLGCDPAEISENSAIFTLGLDSIDAVKLSSRLKRAGIPIPVSRLLQAQTITKMMEFVESQEPEPSIPKESSQLLALENQLQYLRQEVGCTVERILPAAPGQEALIADMLRSDFRDYYNSDILKLRQNVDVNKMKSAWQAVVDVTPILRTSFAQVEDPDIDATFAQIVHQPQPLQFAKPTVRSLEDLSDYLEGVRQDVLSSFMSKPPLRLAFATVESQQYLVLSLAHAQYDGHSLGLLHRDVARAYEDALESRPVYDDAIDLALSATSPEALTFWRSNLTGARISRFAHKETNPQSTTSRSERTSSIKASTARSFCQRLGVSTQALAQAAWALLLSHYVQELDVMFGVVLACRDSEDAEKVMFPTMNTVPVRVALHGSGVQMLQHLQSSINDMRQFQRTPLRAVQAACSAVVQTSSSDSDSAFFDTLFIYQQSGDSDSSEKPSLYESVDGSSNVEYPVAVEVEVVGDRLIMRTACKSHVLDGPGTEELLRRFDFVLDSLVNSPEEPAADFSHDRVSVCGLPSFHLKATGPISSQVETHQNGSEEVESTSMTNTILQAMAQVSKMPVDDISPNSTIESLGIDSISAIKVTALLRKQSIKISVSELLKAQTSRRVAELVESPRAAPVTNRESAMDVIAGHLQNIDLTQTLASAGIGSHNVERVLPAAAGQIYMLAMWKKSGGELFYPAFKYHIDTEVRMDDINAAWQEVVKRNDILRTVFCATNKADIPLLQVILKTAPESFFDTKAPRADSPTQPMVQMVASNSSKGYDLELRIQHSLYDAVSIPRLVEEFQITINGMTPPTPSIGFVNYLALSLTPKVQQSRQNFWKHYLQDAHPLHLRQSRRESSRKVQIFKPAAFSSCASLQHCGREAQVTIQALLFAAYAKVYAAHASNEGDSGDVVFGIYVANRSHLPELDQLAAPTLNLLPIFVPSPTRSGLVDIAKRIDSDLRLIGSAENSGVSLAEIYRWTGVKVDSFVNFLRLPEQEYSMENDHNGAAEAKITEASNEWKDARSEVHNREQRNGQFAMPKEMQNFEAGAAYQVSNSLYPHH